MDAETTYEPVIQDEDINHVAEQVQMGFREGQFLGSDGARIAWSIELNLID